MIPKVTLPGDTLRVGVTGSRRLDPAATARIEAAVSQQLKTILDIAKGHGVTRFILVSPLAEGSDQIVARCALDTNAFTLACPLPFPQAEYETTFDDPAHVAPFRTLLEGARPLMLMLDGDLGPERDRSFEAVGRLVVRNCDLMIGIWDGLPGARGGTAETIRYAANFGPPVIWLHATEGGAPPQWIEKAHDLRHEAAPRAVEGPLGVYLKRLLCAPRPSRHADHHSHLHWCAHWLLEGVRWARRQHLTPVESFLVEQSRRVWWPLRLHGWLIRTMAGGKPAPWTEPVRPDDAIAAVWFERYKRADALAGEFAKRYRSSYVWLFVLGALALGSAGVSLGFAHIPPVKMAATAFEIVTLVAILVAVMGVACAGWQRRAIEYRLLAELCRKQQALAPLGWVVPRAGAWCGTTDHGGKHGGDWPGNDEAWVAWLFSAWLRDTPMPSGTMDAATVAVLNRAAASELVQEQIDYHTARATQNSAASRRMVRVGEYLFGLVLALVCIKFYALWSTRHEHHEGVDPVVLGLGLAGAILPGVSAAFVGIRGYAELELLVDESEAMLKSLYPARAQIAELDPAAPLASQTLGSAVAGVAALMLDDVQGWAKLSRVKIVEA